MGSATPTTSGQCGDPPDQSRVVQVLALDGGGLRGIFTAAALAAWEDDFGTRVADHFDLITGTSTGGIIALGLGLGVSPRQLLELYATDGTKVFPTGLLKSRRIRWLRRAKHNPRHLRAVLERQFGDKLLGASAARLAIPSYDLVSDDVHLFRTPHHPDLRRDWRVSAVDVAMATASAPTYLPVHGLGGYRLVDGGVWANNPTMVGVAEAVDRLGADVRQVRVMNVGTVTELVARPERLDTGGLVAWRRDALDVVLRGQALAAKNHAALIVGRQNVVRVDVPVPHGLHGLDEVRPADLVARAAAASRHSSPDVAQFFEHTPSPYVPLYS